MQKLLNFYILKFLIEKISLRILFCMQLVYIENIFYIVIFSRWVKIVSTLRFMNTGNFWN